MDCQWHFESRMYLHFHSLSASALHQVFIEVHFIANLIHYIGERVYIVSVPTDAPFLGLPMRIYVSAFCHLMNNGVRVGREMLDERRSCYLKCIQITSEGFFIGMFNHASRMTRSNSSVYTFDWPFLILIRCLPLQGKTMKRPWSSFGTFVLLLLSESVVCFVTFIGDQLSFSGVPAFTWINMQPPAVKEGLLTEDNCPITQEQLDAIIRRGELISDHYELEAACFAR